MTSINFIFDSYPAFFRGEPMYFTGTAKIVAKSRMEVPILPDTVQYWKAGATRIQPRPLQEPMIWEIESIQFNDPRAASIDDIETDARRFIRGKYWTIIPARLYSQYLKERGLFTHANVYARLSGGTESGWREAA